MTDLLAGPRTATGRPMGTRAGDHAARPELDRALHHAAAFLDGLDLGSAGPTVPVEDLRARFDAPLPERGTPPEDVIDALAEAAAGGLAGNAGGRFFGWVTGGALPAALAADWLAAAWDQCAVMAAASPAAAVIAETTGAWLKDLLGLPADASYAFVTGCQAAHVTCLAAARHELLARRGWNVELDGLQGAPRLRILTSTEHHGSLQRAARLIGLGLRAIEPLPADADGRLAPETLAAALAADPDAATVVVLQAGDLNIGAFDPYEELIPLAHAAGAWVHVDGAFGLWAAASPRHRHLLAGAEQADSWACDGHKWLNVPYDSGYAFTRHPESHQRAVSHRASYITYGAGARDDCDWTPEWSRRARAIPTYAALRSLGREGVADLIARGCDHARDIVLGIAALPGAELVWEPAINQGLLRFPDPRPGAAPEDHDRRTDAVAEAICASGEAVFSNTTWRGMRCMRVSVVGWSTTADDVRRAIDATAVALAAQPS